MADNFCFDRVHPCNFSPEIGEPISRPVTPKSSPCVIPETLFLACRKVSATFEVFLPIMLAITCCVPCTVHNLFQQSNFSIVDAPSVLHWQTDQRKVSELLRQRMHGTRRCA